MKTATIGIDLGDRRHAVCVLNQEGKIIEECTVANDRGRPMRRRFLSQRHGEHGEKSRMGYCRSVLPVPP